MSSRRRRTRHLVAGLLVPLVAAAVVVPPAAAAAPASAPVQQAVADRAGPDLRSLSGRALDALRRHGLLVPVDLGVPGSSVARFVNDAGVVAGGTRIDGTERAFRWRDGVATLLPDHGRGAQVFDLDERGRAVGYSWGEDSAYMVLWETDGTLVELIGQEGLSIAAAMNEKGVVVGVSSSDSRVFQPVRWQDGLLTELPHLGHGGSAVAVADSGVIGGFVLTDQMGGSRATVWQDGEMHLLPIPDGYVASTLTHMDERGRVYGAVRRDDETLPETAVWVDGQLQVPEVRPNGEWKVNDVNDHGVAVGQGWDWGSEGQYVVVLGPDGRLTYPRTWGGTSSEAFAVDRHGIAVGAAQRPGDVHAVHAVAWVGGYPVTLGDHPAGTRTRGSVARDINDRGRVVGEVNSTLNDFPEYDDKRAVYWDLVPQW